MAVMSACGSSNTTAANAANSCGSGFIYTSNYGCVQQTASCTGTSGIINGTCQVISTQTGSTSTNSCQQGYAWSTTYNSCLQQYGTCTGAYGIYNNQCMPLGTSLANSTTGHTPYQGSCPSGLVQTQMGCVQQGVCNLGYGFGYWGGQAYCFPASASY